MTEQVKRALAAHQNPFRADCVEALAFRGISAAGLVDQLLAQRGRGSLVGPKGSGKTTLLREIAAELDQRGFDVRKIRLSSSSRKVPWNELRGLDAESAVLLDGAEQLGTLVWRFLKFRLKKAACVVTTSHTKAHFPILLQHESTPELLRELVGELVTDPPEDKLLDALYAEHQGNLRSCLAALYDRWADAAGNKNPV